MNDPVIVDAMGMDAVMDWGPLVEALVGSGIGDAATAVTEGGGGNGGS